MTPGTTPLIAVAIFCAIAGFRIGRHKGHPLAGFLLGLLLSVIGLIILAFVPMTDEARSRQAAGKHKAGQEVQRRLAAEQGAGYPSPRTRRGLRACTRSRPWPVGPAACPVAGICAVTGRVSDSRGRR